MDRAPSLLSQIENGRREPRLSLLRAIAEALDVALADLRSFMARDKKRRAGRERWVLLEGLGRPIVVDDVPDAAVEAAWDELRAAFASQPGELRTRSASTPKTTSVRPASLAR